MKYRAHIENMGWQENFVEQGEIAGTCGKKLRMEAIEFDTPLIMSAHIQDVGWTENKLCTEIGTVGEGKRIEAIKIKLEGTPENAGYSIWYRMHVQDMGWLDWSKNGEINGTEGMARRAEAVQVRILPNEVTLYVDTNITFEEKKKEENKPVTPSAPAKKVRNVVDISGHQYNINPQAIKAAGFEGAICKATEGTTVMESFQVNVTNCVNAGLPVGVYCWSCATSDDECRAEAQATINEVRRLGCDFPLGLWIDLEQSGCEGFASRACDIWADELNKNGYTRNGFYCNNNWRSNYIRDDVAARHKFWFAWYNSTCSRDCDIWQYSESAMIDGFNVDANVMYLDYPTWERA